ncbi:MAG TPA: hypothetical protein VH575_12855 [Gemmataceae bacterium]|jgi:hypothetical protein
MAHSLTRRRRGQVVLFHLTPRLNLPSIWRHGLQPCFARGLLPAVWLCCGSRRPWAFDHVSDQNFTSDIVCIRICLPRSWLVRRRRGVWTCSYPIPVSCLVAVSLLVAAAFPKAA